MDRVKGVQGVKGRFVGGLGWEIGMRGLMEGLWVGKGGLMKLV